MSQEEEEEEEGSKSTKCHECVPNALLQSTQDMVKCFKMVQLV